jgi:hypothetical protein
MLPSTMMKFLSIFRLRREERWPALVAIVVFVALNALTIYRYSDIYTQLSANYHHLFVKTFHVSGFDPLTYSVVSSWESSYNPFRHPLLAFLMFIPNQIDQALIQLTGINLVQYVVALLLVFCAFYSFIFLRRIFRDILSLGQGDANLLSAFYFSFAYVMLSCMVPDHFVMSMMMLLLTLYIAGRLMQEGRQMTVVQTVVLFVFTAGISLNNGLKTFLAALFTNGRRFFRPKFIVMAVLVPSALIWLFARWDYRTFVWPKEVARHKAQQKRDADAKAKAYKMAADSMKTAQATDSSRLKAQTEKIMAQQKAKENRQRKQDPMVKNQGKPLMQGEFMRWTDITTPRWASVRDNLFGESLQLHQRYLMKDILRDNRPIIVSYDHWWNDAAEIVVVALFVLGILAGWRRRFLGLSLSFFGLDLLLHIGLGFGINEVYIMTAHWAYVIPIAIGCLLQRAGRPAAIVLRGVLALLTLWLWAWNGTLMVGYMLG